MSRLTVLRIAQVTVISVTGAAVWNQNMMGGDVIIVMGICCFVLIGITPYGVSRQ